MTREKAADDGLGGLTRERAIVADNAALLVIDVQNYCAVAGKGEHADIAADTIPPGLSYYFDRIGTNIKIIIVPGMPSWESIAITRLEDRELPIPTPSPIVSTSDCRLIAFQ